MLSGTELDHRSGTKRARKARPLPSPRQQYEQYLLQRIEDYKNSLSRQAVLRLGDDAVAEMQEEQEGQYILPDVLVADAVDKLIIKRLKIPGFSRWRQKFAKLRQAQREPTHWGLERRSALVAVLNRIEPGDHALVIGGSAEPAVYFLAAHEVRVTCLFEDDATCTRIENRMAAESLTGDFEPFVVRLGSWFPEVALPVHLVVIEAGTLAALSVQARLGLMAWLQDTTVPGGLHAVIAQSEVPAESWLSLYPDWERIALKPEPGRRGTKRGAAPGVLLARPMPEAGAPQHASTA